MPGQWGRTTDNWTWQSGQWVQPPFSNAYWAPGYWRNSGGQFVWQGGHWAAADQGVVVQKPITVPRDVRRNAAGRAGGDGLGLAARLLDVARHVGLGAGRVHPVGRADGGLEAGLVASGAGRRMALEPGTLVDELAAHRLVFWLISADA